MEANLYAWTLGYLFGPAIEPCIVGIMDYTGPYGWPNDHDDNVIEIMDELIEDGDRAYNRPKTLVIPKPK